MNRAPRRFLLIIFTVAAAAGLSLFTVLGAGKTNGAAAAEAATIYNRQCVSCHGRDGRGRTPKGRQTRARDMTEASWQDDVSDERLFNSINNGRGKMPAFSKKISENDIDALVAYIRRMRR
ncbi:MAG TPA: cytochrome c [Pyrinomonadaceae bacterium]|nr:cytochrome c [Pyrinomonadaceae bacterium]